MKKDLIKNIKKVIFYIWVVIVFVLIAMPMPVYDGDIEKMYDKVAHVIMFGGVAYLFILAYEYKFKKLSKLLLTAFILGVSYSAIAEVIQNFVPGRDVSELDLLAGIIGTIISLIISYVQFKRF